MAQNRTEGETPVTRETAAVYRVIPRTNRTVKVSRDFPSKGAARRHLKKIETGGAKHKYKGQKNMTTHVVDWGGTFFKAKMSRKLL